MSDFQSTGRFIHLRVHSDFSLSEGLCKPSALIERAAQLGLPALALTDLASLAGWPKFQAQAFKKGIKPIAGLELVARHGRLSGRITLFAKNKRGFKALLKLLTAVWSEASEVPSPSETLVPLEAMLACAPDVLFTSGGTGSLAHSMLQRTEKEQRDFFSLWEPGDFFLEVQRTGRSVEEEENQAFLELALRYHQPIVATHPTWFLFEDQYVAHQVRVAIQRGTTLEQASEKQEMWGKGNYLVDPERLVEKFRDLPEALENSVEIAKRCTLEPEEFSYQLPRKIGVEEEGTELASLALEGLQERLASRGVWAEEAVYQERVQQELSVIHAMGFSSYFLVVHDFIRWAKKEGIPVGPGRGSGVGSLVAYALFITELDPIRFHLLFERFLNPDRVSLPDFDIDFCPKGRDRVVQYVVEQYGADSVAQIATFGTLRARAALRDVGRAIGQPYGFVDRWVRFIPFELDMTLSKALEASEDLHTAYTSDDEVRQLFDLALSLEGTVRSMGKHAGGVIIAPQPLTEYTPLVSDAEGKHRITQFDKDDLEALGLVKFDFLGLTTLTVLRDAVLAINRHRLESHQEALDLSEIPLDDPKSYELLRKAKTSAIFQLEAPVARELIYKLAPDRFEEVVALVALNRPGPLQSGMVDNFIQRKHGKEEVAYPDKNYQHPLLKPILEETYGIILYQEQVIKIAQVLAGYTLAEADLLRRAIGKKKAKEMVENRNRFCQGAHDQGVDARLAGHLFDLVEKFSGYGFNKSHSAAYAMITYQCLYLKAHYPDYYMAAMMTAEADHVEKLPALVQELKNLGGRLAPPDINGSQVAFEVDKKGEVLYGLSALKGIGVRVAEQLVEERKKGGAFKNPVDFFYRMSCQGVPKAAFERFVDSGALDLFGVSRSNLLRSLPSMLEAFQSMQRASRACREGQTSLFAEAASPPSDLLWQQLSDLPRGEPDYWEQWEAWEREDEVLGHSLSVYPLDLLKEGKLLGLASEKGGALLQALARKASLGTLAVLLRKVKWVRGKTGKTFCVLLCDAYGIQVEAIWEGAITEELQRGLKNRGIFFLKGRFRASEVTEKVRVQLESLETLAQARERQALGVVLVLNSSLLEDRQEKRIQAWLHWLQQARSEGGGIKSSVEVVEGPHRVVWHFPHLRLNTEIETWKFPEDFSESLEKIRIDYPGGSVEFPWNRAK